MFCENCGNQNPNSAKFCKGCGNVIFIPSLPANRKSKKLQFVFLGTTVFLVFAFLLIYFLIIQPKSKNIEMNSRIVAENSEILSDERKAQIYNTLDLFQTQLNNRSLKVQDLFAPQVIQYITIKNTTPEAIRNNLENISFPEYLSFNTSYSKEKTVFTRENDIVTVVIEAMASFYVKSGQYYTTLTTLDEYKFNNENRIFSLKTIQIIKEEKVNNLLQTPLANGLNTSSIRNLDNTIYYGDFANVVITKRKSNKNFPHAVVCDFDNDFVADLAVLSNNGNYLNIVWGNSGNAVRTYFGISNADYLILGNYQAGKVITGNDGRQVRTVGNYVKIGHFNKAEEAIIYDGSGFTSLRIKD